MLYLASRSSVFPCEEHGVLEQSISRSSLTAGFSHRNKWLRGVVLEARSMIGNRRSLEELKAEREEDSLVTWC